MLTTDAKISFSDEAHFWTNGYVNKQNCRVWDDANPHEIEKCPMRLKKSLFSVDFALEDDNYQLLQAWIGWFRHQRHAVSTVWCYESHSSCHVGYSARAIWGHGNACTWRACGLATEIVRFDSVGLFLVGLSHRFMQISHKPQRSSKPTQSFPSVKFSQVFERRHIPQTMASIGLSNEKID